MPRPPKSTPSRTLRTLTMAVAGALVAALLSLAAPVAAQAAEKGSIVNGGFIISDADFFDADAMTVKEIQTFLTGKVPTCKATKGNPTCLKSFTADLPAKKADAYCKAVAKNDDATAAEIIAASAAACGISPKVILVMLQKEQGLVTSTAPSARAYRAAMGQGCPDTAPCDTAQAGFVNQVYRGARQLQVYTKTPNSWNYKAGKVNTILWSPTRSCGTSKVYIENQATANLYIYTPYRPNIAALAAGYGTGDACSTYGNRNFYNYYYGWFGGQGASGAPAQVPACTTPASADIVSASGSRFVNTASLNARTAPTTACATGLTKLDKGAVVKVTGSYGAWTRATAGSKTVWLASQYLSAVPITPAPTVSGSAVSGQVLTAALGTWSPAPTGVSYQWTRDKVAVRGETRSTYRVTEDDAGSAIAVVVTATVPGAGTVTKTSAAKNASGYDVGRLAGEDRYVTGVEVSRAAYPKGAKTVYLATGADFADALAAAPLAASQDASLLLTKPNVIPEVVATELKRLGATKVVLIGGSGVIDAGMPARLKKLLGSSLTVTRVGGSDRYDTARKIAAAWSSAPTVYISTGGGYADALGAAAIAGAKNAPVLLVKGTNPSMPTATLTTLSKLKTKSVVVVGGEGVVSKGIASQLTAKSLKVTRFGGINRYATNALLNKGSFASAKSVVVATGVDFPDALTGSVLAAGKGSPIFITPQTCASAELADFLLAKKATSVQLVGGTGVLWGAVARLERC